MRSRFSLWKRLANEPRSSRETGHLNTHLTVYNIFLVVVAHRRWLGLFRVIPHLLKWLLCPQLKFVSDSGVQACRDLSHRI